ncbi:MAG TPA: universal stress protein [Verrucomicrobiota bacterium]|jgi:universal stress protein A|nr:universal stress protein [Verrucomicrobiota bacterium]HRT09600.1 universal stress protein [Candidatus Paceibacterota bacterium]HRT58846.1 universal stress protein [Candidatus Paceibacterota bacterium]
MPIKAKPTLNQEGGASEDSATEPQEICAEQQYPPLAINLRKLLVPLDFSECACHALRYAAAFAGKVGASLVLLHVVEPAVGGDHYLSLAPTLDDANEHQVAAGRERLEALCQRQVCRQLSCQTLVRLGWAASEIVDTALALGADLIVMGTHGRSGLKHVLLGSTAEKVVRQAPCPVLTIRHTRE